MTRSPRRRWVVAALTGLFLWTSYGCAVEVYRCAWIRWNDPWTEPSRWRIQSACVEGLRAFVEMARTSLPESAEIAYSTASEEQPEAFFRYLWLAYLLPEHDLRFADLADSPDTEYRVIHGGLLEDPGWSLVVGSTGLALYRSGAVRGRDTPRRSENP